MKNRNTILVFSVILAIVCLYQLSFTFKVKNFESKARAHAALEVKKSGVKFGPTYRRYIDSMGNKTIYDFGLASYSYFDCKQREINLGLDLRGGMNVILEVDKSAIISGMANDKENPELVKALEFANKKVREEGGNYVDLFIANYKSLNPNVNLINLFANKNNSALGKSTTEASLTQYINEEVNGSIDRVREVVEKRINQSNVTQPTIQKVDNGRISVELPGVDNPKRMEDLVEKSANLEFYEVHANYEYLREGDAIMEKLFGVTTKIAFEATDSSTSDSTLAKKTKTASVLSNYITRTLGMAASGLVKGTDIKKVLEIFEGKQYQNILASNRAVIAFSAKAADYDASLKQTKGGNDYEIFLLKLGRDGKSSLNSEDGNIISDARFTTGQTGQLEVNMTMTAAAGNEWSQITGNNEGRPIAIVLDNRVYSAPRVNQKITGGSSQITGNFDVNEADDLANVLKAGKLPAPAKIVASEVVGPSLGEASIKKGTWSLVIGFFLVLIFMVVYYRGAGLIAVIAVLANMFIIIGVLSSLGAALTLPGIAGVLLTIGMAVDSNVLIFERIKEELQNGKSIKQSVSEGYRHAMSAILDSNITTLLAGVILTMAGAGPAYGFAVILVIGIFSSLFTALLLARVIMDSRIRKDKSISFDTSWNRGFLKNKSIDFVGSRKKYYMISGIAIAIGICAFVMKGGLSTGIDFKGGNAFVVQMDPSESYSTDDIKETLDVALPESSNEVKTFGSDGQYRVVTTYLLKEDSKEAREKAATAVTEALGAKFKLTTKTNADGVAEGPILSSSKIGEAIATNVRNKSTLLVILALVGMFFYIVFRFRSATYGAGATVALIHDVFLVLSIFVILDGVVPFPVEFDQHLIAALLTLVGYSMNDTVIVFDRIREILAGSKSADRSNKDLINKAINSTLSRTIITASTVFFVVLALFFLGGDSLKGFSLALLIGVIVGTYSSICIATPVVVDLTSKKGDKKKK
jgi:SecD/SecF fusion protein